MNLFCYSFVSLFFILIRYGDIFMCCFVVMGNWKLNGSKVMVIDLLNGLNVEFEGVEGVDVVVVLLVMYLDLVECLIKEGGNKLILGV